MIMAGDWYRTSFCVALNLWMTGFILVYALQLCIRAIYPRNCREIEGSGGTTKRRSRSHQIMSSRAKPG
ncbi:hypothetical protein ABKN59_004863 [Abortiporus biennis]